MEMIYEIFMYATSGILFLLAIASFLVEFPDMERNFWNIMTPLLFSLAAFIFIYQWHKEEKYESTND